MRHMLFTIGNLRIRFVRRKRFLCFKHPAQERDDHRGRFMYVTPPTNAEPLSGKTYTLYGSADNTDVYFDRIRSIADLCLARYPDVTSLLSIVQNASRPRRRLKKLLGSSFEIPIDSFLACDLKDNFAEYTAAVAGHLKELPLMKSWDRTLAMRQDQYHLAMLEIEL